MELGMIGLGRMGANMAERLRRGGHRIVGFDPKANEYQQANAKGVELAQSIAELVGHLPPPRAVWLMVPAGDAVDQTIATLLPLLAPGDVIIDGGNSNYRDSQRRALALADSRIDYVDCGTSGGVWGLQEGYSLMIGGGEAVIERLRPLFATLAPAPDRGWGRVGPSGAGHFTKMIHNGIEYGLMQAYAEGFSLLQHKSEFTLDLHQVADIWRHGSVVRSRLLDLTADALGENPALDGIAPCVADSGEGRWTVLEALELGVAAPVITLAMLARLRSRDPSSFSDKLLAALRQQFGGHAVLKEQTKD
ncbi:phosphogluconate dehydrogenase (NAD(+)-dependent, decarboxylating) [Propionivibrio sp.]|uniref:phosphogluconate dehydrogenase (NAD(+)-dependent, decarboxylating) n=1 Tax=Propionivibrio sp. TaxID=2212460 RepID=UPI003BEF6089